MKKHLLMFGFILTLTVANAPTATAITWPVADYLGRWLSKTTVTIQQAANWVHNTTAPFVKTFKDVQKFFHKAKTVVNSVIKNMRMIEDIVEINKEIKLLFSKTVDSLNEPRDINGDGEDDIVFLDKWKHIQILLAISSEAVNVFEIFSSVIGENAMTMDDKGRIKFIQDTLKELRKIRSAMKVQIRRINKEIYQFERLKREVNLYEELFSAN